MSRINWNIRLRCQLCLNFVLLKWSYWKVCWRSLTHNAHMNTSYATDVCMEPMIWFVDNYTHLLGPFFVMCVTILTMAVVSVAYWIGLPFWWTKSPFITVILLIVGNWLLLNVIFHYVMAVFTPAGNIPMDTILVEVVSICKKCIVPKPPRTHHCSVCNSCILKMDHHCPWLNNCVGFGNHRYFFLYMLFTTLGSLFLIIFGLEIGYKYLWLEESDNWIETEPLIGQPIKFNLSGHIIPVAHLKEYDDSIVLPAHHNLPTPADTIDANSSLVLHRRKALIFMAFTNIAVVLALGTLCCWHGKLITRGETSIEAHINRLQQTQSALQNKLYVNPYNFGPQKNWRLFLGLVRGRSFWRTVLLPSWHQPEGDGLIFHTVHDYAIASAASIYDDEWP